MSPLQKIRMLVLAVCFICAPAIAPASVPVAVFPLQELGEGRNDANIPFTEVLAERLADSGNEIIGLDTIIAFMANNRIRHVGYLENLHISWARRDLGAAFVLLGTVTQRKENREPSMGLTLNLVRTSDLRTIWTYAGSVSTGEERRLLGIGEPQSVSELQSLLLDEIMEQWPWEIVNDEHQLGSFSIDSAVLEPEYVRPGGEVHSLVRLANTWAAGQAPRVFFKADEQLYPATISADGHTYEGDWVAGEENGRVPVTLLLEWPHYGRTETALLGNYLIDGTQPLIEVELRGTKLLDGKQVFNRQLIILPRMLIRKPLARWRLAFYVEGNSRVADMDGTGNLPESFIWTGRENIGDGLYEIVVEVWDKAGNTARASQWAEMNRSLPDVDLALSKSEDKMVVELNHDNKVPLKYWRLEMWTKEGKILTQSEGRELPVKIGIELPDPDKKSEIRGVLFYQDVLGKEVRRKVEDLLPKLSEDTEAVKKKKSKGISENWVDEF